MNQLSIPPDLIRKILEQAEREYPNECCGMIFGSRQKPGELLRVRECRNVQEAWHVRDPENFPRTAKTAYFIDPRELLAVQKEIRAGNEEIRVIYHSHIDAGAYFSEEDKRVAAPEGEPAYQGVDYLVVSVTQGKVNGSHLFRWDPAKKDFLQIS